MTSFHNDVAYMFLPDYASAFTLYATFPLEGAFGNIKFIGGVKTNIGGHYSTSTGQITCEYPGLYLFSVNIYKKKAANQGSCYIRQNGVYKGYAGVNQSTVTIKALHPLFYI